MLGVLKAKKNKKKHHQWFLDNKCIKLVYCIGKFYQVVWQIKSIIEALSVLRDNGVYRIGNPSVLLYAEVSDRYFYIP